MQFTGGAVGHKSTQGVTRVFSQDSHELGGDRDCEMGAQQERSSDLDVETRDRDELSIDDEEEDAEGEEEIEYGYREDEDGGEGDADNSDEGIDLGPEDGEECWEDGVLDLEGYAAL